MRSVSFAPISRQRVLFLNRSYWPDMEATGQLLTELCEGLSSRFEVEVVSGQPNSISPAAPEDWRTLETRNSVRINRLRHTQFAKGRLWTRAVNYLTFSVAVRHALRRWSAPDAVVFETDPFLLAFEAHRLSQRTGCRLIGYLQDIHPDVGIALGKIRNSYAVRRLRESLFRVYRDCDRIVVLSQDMRKLLCSEGVAPERVTVIPNWADTERIVPVTGVNAFRRKHGLEGRFLVMYSGNLGMTQRLSDFVSAAALLAEDPRIHFAFVGRGALEAELRADVAARQLRNVSFFDYQPRETLGESLSAADLHLVPLTASLAGCLMPSKLYGILAAGRPCLTNAPAGTELHRLVCEEEVGFAVPSGSVVELADAIREAAADPQRLQQMNERSRRLAETCFSRELSIAKFGSLLEGVLQCGVESELQAM